MKGSRPSGTAQAALANYWKDKEMNGFFQGRVEGIEACLRCLEEHGEGSAVSLLRSEMSRRGWIGDDDDDDDE